MTANSEAFDLIEYNAADHMTELEWQNQLQTKLLPQLGFMSYHVPDSRMCPAGFPDLHIIDVTNDIGRVIYAELKRQLNWKVSNAQEFYLDTLEAKGHEVYLWRPRDLERISDILTGGMPENHLWRDWI